MVRYSKWISLFAFVLLLVACFLPWTYHADVNQDFTGFYSAKNMYGKPAKLLLVFAGITTLCAFVPVLWMKRTALLVGGLSIAYAIKNFLLFGSCYVGYCPEKKYGLYLMLFSSTLIFFMSLFPENIVFKPKNVFNRSNIIKLSITLSLIFIFSMIVGLLGYKGYWSAISIPSLLVFLLLLLLKKIWSK